MRRSACSLLLLPLAGCEAFGHSPASQTELPGEWVMLDGYLKHPDVCGTHGPITYEPSGTAYIGGKKGTWRIWGEQGTWRLEGNFLTEATTYADPMHSDTTPEEIGKPYVSTLQWVDPNTFLKRFADGEVRTFRRCPKSN